VRPVRLGLARPPRKSRQRWPTTAAGHASAREATPGLLDRLVAASLPSTAPGSASTSSSSTTTTAPIRPCPAPSAPPLSPPRAEHRPHDRTRRRTLDRGIDYSGAARHRPPRTRPVAGSSSATRPAPGTRSRHAVEALRRPRDPRRGRRRPGLHRQQRVVRVPHHRGHRRRLADGRADLAFWKSRGLAKGRRDLRVVGRRPVRRSGRPPTPTCGPTGPGSPATTARRLRRHPVPAARPRREDHRLRVAPERRLVVERRLPYQPATSTAAQASAARRAALKATPAAIWQTGNYWWSKGADECLILRPCGSHLQALAAAPVAAKPARSRRQAPAEADAGAALPGAGGQREGAGLHRPRLGLHPHRRRPHRRPPQRHPRPLPLGAPVNLHHRC
jgi:hypothetical protein